MAKQDSHSLGHLFKIFTEKEGYVWFLEFIETNEWLTEEKSLTKDPLKAKQFKTEISALNYRLNFSLGIDYQPTEHQFIDKE